MEKVLLIISLSISNGIAFSQTVDFDSISYRGLNFYSSKIEIIEKLGQPQKTYNPKLECGFLSSDSQNEEYLTLDFGEIKFTGNKEELYLIEQVDFENNPLIVLKYGNHNLNCETKLSDLIVVFGSEIRKCFDKNLSGGLVLFRENADDGIRIELKNGRLVRFEYWSPC